MIMLNGTLINMIDKYAIALYEISNENEMKNEVILIVRYSIG